MGIHFPRMVHHTRQILRQRSLHKQESSSSSPATTKVDVPKGHFAVYVGETTYKHRFVIPISYLKHPLFQGLLRQAEEEFGYDHPMGGLTIPCSIVSFLNVTSLLNYH